jgi:3-deoxy-7-phosphoheptulonate synthase
MKTLLSDRKIASSRVLPSPQKIWTEFAACSKVVKTVSESRQAVIDILQGTDRRLLVIVGPCSIHDMESAREYAARLKTLAEKVKESQLLIMRTYFEKPRTVGGWKGYLNDPGLDGSFRMEDGIKSARSFLLECGREGLAVGTEMLDLISPQYLADLICWSAIGARTTESQSHRELASGLSMPVGFKNATNGDIEIAVNAIRSASQPHHFLSVDELGQASVFGTKGNSDCHVVLRGGGGKSNYEADSVENCRAQLVKASLVPSMIVDCSHGNSNKDFKNQGKVFRYILEQIGQKADCGIKGVMIESNIHSGNQSFPREKEKLEYGVSITDGCIGWEETEELILEAHKVISSQIVKDKRAA